MSPFIRMDIISDDPLKNLDNHSAVLYVIGRVYIQSDTTTEKVKMTIEKSKKLYRMF